MTASRQRLMRQAEAAQAPIGSATSATSTAPTVTAANYRPKARNTLQGFADLTITKLRLTIRGCAWHRKGDREWVSFPSRPYQDQTSGETKYADILQFEDRAFRERFQAAALDALRKLAAGGGE